MPQRKDLTERRFGRLVALEPTDRRDSRGNVIWLCKCDCGATAQVPVNSLTSGNTRSCGCLMHTSASQTGHNNALDISGQRFERLVALYPIGGSRQQSIIWQCRCDCGNYTKVTTGNLNSGGVRSCGCLRREVTRARNGPSHPNWKGGTRTKNKKIRMSPEYKGWRHKVFERDCFTCQACGQSKCYIEAHHIKDFSSYPDLRFVVINGITLCSKCHRAFHRRYGYNCSVSDIQEFLQEECHA